MFDTSSLEAQVQAYVEEKLQEQAVAIADRIHIVRRHIVGGANRTLFSVDLPPRLCRTGT